MVFRQLPHLCRLGHHGRPRLHPPGLHDIQGFEQPGGEEGDPGQVPNGESQLREDFQPVCCSFLEEKETNICWTLVDKLVSKYKMEKHRDDGQIHSRPSPSSEKTCVVGKIYISSFNKYICVETAATASGGGEELADALRNLHLGGEAHFFQGCSGWNMGGWGWWGLWQF